MLEDLLDRRDVLLRALLDQPLLERPVEVEHRAVLERLGADQDLLLDHLARHHVERPADVAVDDVARARSTRRSRSATCRGRSRPRGLSPSRSSSSFFPAPDSTRLARRTAAEYAPMPSTSALGEPVPVFGAAEQPRLLRVREATRPRPGSPASRSRPGRGTAPLLTPRSRDLRRRLRAMELTQRAPAPRRRARATAPGGGRRRSSRAGAARRPSRSPTRGSRALASSVT